MTNRGTARKMSMYLDRHPDGWGEDSDKKIVRAIFKQMNRPLTTTYQEKEVCVAHFYQRRV